MTLEECLMAAQSGNPDLAKSALEDRLSGPGVRAALGRFLPTLTVGYTADQSRFYSPTYLNPDGSVATFPRIDSLYSTYVDSAGYVRMSPEPYIRVVPVPEGSRRSSGIFIRAEEILFDGGRNFNSYRNSLYANDLREAQQHRLLHRVRLQTTRDYCTAVNASQRLILARRTVEMRTLLLDLASTRLSIGSVTRRDVLQAEVDLGRARSDSLQAGYVWRRALDDLRLTLGLPLDQEIQLAGLPSPTPFSRPLEDLVSSALAGRDDRRAAELQMKIEGNDLRSAKGDYLPLVALNLTHNRSEQSGLDVGWRLTPRNRFTSVGLTASWQIFDRFTRGLRLEEARVRLHQTRLDMSEHERRIHLEVTAAFERLQALYEQFRAAEGNVRLARETLAFEQERYRLGAATLIDVNLAQVSYERAEGELIETTGNYHIALGELEFAVGEALRSAP